MTRTLSILLLLLYAGFNAQRLAGLALGWPGHHGPSPFAVLALLGFTLVHGRARLGGRALAAFAFIVVTVTFVMETISIATGLVGEYHYTSALGARIGTVPVLIPIAWLMMTYPSLVLVEVATGELSLAAVRARHGVGRAIGWSAVVSLLVGVAMAAWDLGIEPVIVVTRDYVWVHGGEYFGVPVANFVGWVATSFAVCFAYLLYEVWRPLKRPDARAEAPAWLGVAAYATTAVITVSAALAVHNRAAALAGTFALAPWILGATAQLVRPRADGPHATGGHGGQR